MQNSGFKTKILTAITFGLVSQYSMAALPDTLKLDYAYYAPTSLVVKEQKLLEKALPKTQIKWVFSQGSNRSLEYLNSGSVDFSSTAGLAAVPMAVRLKQFISRVSLNGQPYWLQKILQLKA